MMNDTEEILARGIRGYIVIYSGNQAALKALSSYKIASGLVLQWYNAPETMDIDNELISKWVKGYKRNPSNKAIDELAGRASHSPFMGSESVIPVLSARLNALLNHYFKNKWKYITICPQALNVVIK